MGCSHAEFYLPPLINTLLSVKLLGSSYRDFPFDEEKTPPPSMLKFPSKKGHLSRSQPGKFQQITRN